MTVDPLAILTKRIRFVSLILLALLSVYVIVSTISFYQWVRPSLTGQTDQHIAADSTTYIFFANAIRDGQVTPQIFTALASFPNTLWMPVLLVLIFKTPFAIMMVDYVCFFSSIALLKRAFSFSTGIFMGLLLLNPTTTISLLSVNKEIIDLLVISLFFYSRRHDKKGLLTVSLLLATLNRYEVCIVLLVFMAATSRHNPWRQRRFRTLAALVIGISILLPILAQNALNAHFQEASGGGMIARLDSMEMNYMYMVAVVPKIMETFLGELFDVSRWGAYNFTNLANSYILWFNNFASLIVLSILAVKRNLSIRDNLIYFSIIAASVMAISLVIQPRYFYFIYVVLCLQAALSKRSQKKSYVSLIHNGEIPANA